MSAYGDVPGAVSDERGLAHLGSPLAEQRALADGSALALLEDRAVLAVAGEDRLSWLDSLTSQSLAHLVPGSSTETLVLDPHGHVEHAAAVVDDGRRVWLIVDRARAAALLAWLRRMRFRLRVDPEDLSETHHVVAGTAAAVEAVPAVAVWHDPWPRVVDGGWGYAAADVHPGTARDWSEAIVTTSARAGLLERAARGEQALAGHLAADALRIAAWRPTARTEADERTLPHEVDWLRTAVHLSKGCYRGQETVAKVHNLGHPPRRLVALQLDGTDPQLPGPGAEVRAGEDVVGHVTSSARHYEEGPIALAILKRGLSLDAPLTVDGDDGPVAAVQETIVPPSAGRTASVPRMPRLSRR